MVKPLLDKLPVGICIVDEHYHIVSLNAFFLDRMSDDAKKHYLNQPIADVFPEQAKFLKRRIKSVFVLKHPSFSYWEQRPHIFPFKSSRPITGEETQMVQNMEIVPLRDESTGNMQACILIQDVTAQASYFKAQSKLAEKLKQEHEAQRQLIRKLDSAQAQLIQAEKMASTGQLAAGIAHEINNPVGFIKANMETLEQYSEHLLTLCRSLHSAIGESAPGSLAETADDLLQQHHFDLLTDDIPELLQESKHGLDRISEIVTNLRSFAIEKQDGWQWVNVHETANQLIQLVGTQYKTPVYKVTCEPQNIKIYCDPSGVKQALMNLVLNAAQSIPAKGFVKIDIIKKVNIIIIKVIDSGQGISQDNLSRIFEPFFTTKPEGQGQGLGLSVAYTAIEQHDGRIIANSRMGKGTVFEVRLPIEPNNKKNRVPTASDSTS